MVGKLKHNRRQPENTGNILNIIFICVERAKRKCNLEQAIFFKRSAGETNATPTGIECVCVCTCVRGC